jgi:DNA-binding NtrC family response regulator
MPKKGSSILSVSYDESLLHTRHWILETAGFKVTSALGFTQATNYSQTGHFDLVIIGHSIPREDKEALLKVVRNHKDIPVLSLRRVGDAPLPGVDHAIETWDGPEALLTAVRHLLSKKPDSESE